MGKNRDRKRNHDADRKRDDRQTFADILRQTNGLHRPRPDFTFGGMGGMGGKVIALMSRAESVEDEDAVTIPMDEYRSLLSAKVILGLLLKASETNTLSDYNIGALLNMINGKCEDAAATADA